MFLLAIKMGVNIINLTLLLAGKHDWSISYVAPCAISVTLQ